MDVRIVVLVAVFMLPGGRCTAQEPAAAASAHSPGQPSTTTVRVASPAPPRASGFAARSSPIRGAERPDHDGLIAYPGNVVRTSGISTWHRATVSEAQARAAIASGHLRIELPDGRLLDIAYDRHAPDSRGGWTWIGHLAGREEIRTVITFAADSVFGRIGQDAGLPFRLTMRDGLSWLVATDYPPLHPQGIAAPGAAVYRADAADAGRDAAHDLDGDGRSDLFWRNLRIVDDSGNMAWYSADSATRQALGALADPEFRVVAIADFDGDGASDVYWRARNYGDNWIWRSGNDQAPMSTQDLDNPDWRVAGAGDFNGDGEDDVLWRNVATGANTIWHSANQRYREPLVAVGDTRWKVAGVGDFNGDGEADLFWRHAVTGKNTAWYSADRSRRDALPRVSDPDWHVAGVGDFNADGRDDVLWRHATDGRNVIWKSANRSSRQNVTRVANTAWQAEATGDYDGDGHADIFWRNAGNGDNVLWPAADRSRRRVLISLPTEWAVVP